MRAAIVAAVLLVAPVARADKTTRKDAGLVLAATGVGFAAIGAGILARGIVNGDHTCAASPMSTDVCGGESRALKIAGGTVLGTMLTVSLSGAVLLGTSYR